MSRIYSEGRADGFADISAVVIREREECRLTSGI